ncbi:MAG TPA: histidine phosphatase family protein [Pyrinomonadaceae bacterium]|jgi:phosphohistidine phosphatase
MKTLLLLRHAKPSQISPTRRDFDRPLVDAGRADALLVGQFLRRTQLAPGLVICSPAARARQTAAHVVEAAEITASTLFDERLYEASAEQLMAVVAEAGGDAGMILLVAHNPGLPELIARLTGEHAAMIPGTLARVDLDTDAWSTLGAGRGQLVFARPPQEASPDR